MKKIGVIGLIILIALMAVAGSGYLYYSSSVNGGKLSAEPQTIKIEQGDSPSSITTNLKENGVIKSELCFKVYLKQTETSPTLQYGTFEINKGMSYAEIVEILQAVNTDVETVTVTFPEGSTVIQFANIMEKAGLCTADEFLEEANNGDFSEVPIWSEIKHDDNVFMKSEGYLFPSTYEFFPDDTVHNMVKKLYSQFDKVWTEERGDKAKELGFSVSDIVSLASFIQEEAGDPVNMPGVSGVFHNRLAEGSPYPKLQSDVSWYYISDFIRPYYADREEKAPDGIEEDYYTYDCIGLPAGPLSCPGEAAIDAALNPEINDYYFFLTDFSAKYYYAVTDEEHLANIETMKSINGEIKASIGGGGE